MFGTLVQLALVAHDLVCKLTEASLFVGHGWLAVAVVAQIENIGEGADTRFGKVSEPFASRQYLVFVVVEVRAVSFGAVYAVLALLLLEEARMILLLLPPVREAALVLEVAAVSEGGDEGVRLPVRAHFVAVRELVGFAAVVLPVVSVETHFAVVVIFFVGAPHCLEMVQVEVRVDFVFLDHFH